MLQESIRGTVIHGSVLMVGMRWAVRLLGLVSTVILARILTPADFGLVAMAMIAVGLIEILSETAVDMALIRHANPDREHFDSAWTMAALTSLGLTVVLNIIAEPVGAYFGEPKAELVIRILSLKTMLVGFENIGTVWFRRSLDFTSEFTFGFAKKIVPAVVTVGLAFWLRDYRALVVGIVVGQVFSVLLSYWIHPFRPRISFAKITELWSFSIWILIADVGQYLHSQVGRFFIGSTADLAALGKFTVSGELAGLPKTEVIDPISRALYPAYSRLISDPDRLRAAFLNVLSATAIVAASAFAGIAFVADDFLWLLLGDQWVSAAPLMFWIAIATAFQSYSNTVFMVLNAMGQSRRSAAQTWLRFFILVVVLAFVSQSADIEGMAASIAYATIALTPTYLWTLRRVLPFSWWSVFSVSWRPLVASAAMIAWLTLLKSQLLGLSPPARLLLEVPTGALVFASALWVLWLASGKPVGVEHAAILTLGSRLKSLAAAFDSRRR